MVNILSVDSLLSVVNAYNYQQFLFLCVSLSICQFVCITLCMYVCMYYVSIIYLGGRSYLLGHTHTLQKT